MRLRVLLLTMLLAPTFATAQADPPEPLRAEGPDEEGAWRLSYALRRESAGPVTLALRVLREDGAGTVEATRALPPREAPAGASTVEVAFLPAEGAGDYAVALAADGLEGAPLRFRVEHAGAAARFAFEVRDEPTALALANDPVNAEGKTKSPGEAVLTRALLRDGNGVADVEGVVQRVERDGTLVDESAVPLAAGANATEAAFEARWSRAPLEAGPYRVTLHAMKAGASVANLSRTFLVRDAPPTLLAGNLTPALAGRASTQTAEVVLADRNGPTGPLELRVYRASLRMEGAGFAAEATGARRLADAEGAGRTALALALRAPANATPGAYRVSILAEGVLVGSLPFEVRAAPALANLTAEPAPGGGLRLVARGEGRGHLAAEAVDAAGARTTGEAAFAAGAGEVTLPGVGPFRWTLRLLAWEGGEVIAEREGVLVPAGPALRISPRHVSPRLPASWSLAAEEGRDVARAAASFDVRRWDGAPAAGVTARLEGDIIRVAGPAGLDAGRYDATLRLAWPDGARAEASWSFEAGPWMRVSVGEAQVAGREARVPLRNDGGLPLRRLATEAAPEAVEVTLLVNGTAAASRAGAAGRRVFTGFELAPGAEAELIVRLPAGPQRAGAREATLRVLALPGGA